MTDFLKNPMKTGEPPKTEPLDPYLLAQQAWDGRMSAVLEVNRRKDLVIFGLLIVVIASLISHAILYTQKDIQAFLVKEQTAEVVDLRVPWRASDAAKRSRLQDLVEKWRGLSLDPIINKKNQEQVAAWITPAVSQSFREDYQKRQKEVADRRVVACTATEVLIIAIQPLGDGLWQIRWQEICYANGTRTATSVFTGTGVLDDRPPADLEELRANPLGLILSKFRWTRENAQKQD